MIRTGIKLVHRENFLKYFLARKAQTRVGAPSGRIDSFVQMMIPMGRLRSQRGSVFT